MAGYVYIRAYIHMVLLPLSVHTYGSCYLASCDGKRYAESGCAVLLLARLVGSCFLPLLLQNKPPEQASRTACTQPQELSVLAVGTSIAQLNEQSRPPGESIYY